MFTIHKIDQYPVLKLSFFFSNKEEMTYFLRCPAMGYIPLETFNQITEFDLSAKEYAAKEKLLYKLEHKWIDSRSSTMV